MLLHSETTYKCICIDSVYIFGAIKIYIYIVVIIGCTQKRRRFSSCVIRFVRSDKIQRVVVLKVGIRNRMKGSEGKCDVERDRRGRRPGYRLRWILYEQLIYLMHLTIVGLLDPALAWPL